MNSSITSENILKVFFHSTLAGKGYFVHLASILAKDSISRSSENFTFLHFLALSIHGLNLTRPTKYCSGLPQFLKTQI